MSIITLGMLPQSLQAQTEDILSFCLFVLGSSGHASPRGVFAFSVLKTSLALVKDFGAASLTALCSQVTEFWARRTKSLFQGEGYDNSGRLGFLIKDVCVVS